MEIPRRYRRMWINTVSGEIGWPGRAARGSMGLEIAFWLVGLVTLPAGIGFPILLVAFFYSVWRSGRGERRLGGPGPVARVSSPGGSAVYRKFYSEAEPGRIVGFRTGWLKLVFAGCVFVVVVYVGLSFSSV